ncbi:MAG: NnrS family protein [Rhizobacter sp.]
MSAAPAGSGWQVVRLLSAPHRLGFFAAALVFAASGLWWAGVWIAGAMGLPPAWAVPPAAAHAVFMSLGFMPLFVTGFWFTAGPRWLGLPGIDARSLLWPAGAMLLSWGLAVAGFHASAWLAALGLALGAAAWTALCWRFTTMLRRSRADDRLHASGVTLACWAGAAAWWVAAGAAAMEQINVLRSASIFALWGFAATVFTVASHRMLPFFEGGAPGWLEALPPRWLLVALCGALWVEGVFSVASLWWQPWPRGVLWSRVVLDASVGGLLLGLAGRWALMHSLRIRLLAMLHAGLLWLAVSFGLAAVSGAMLALSDGHASLGLAPVHALTMGYLGTTLMAMAARVVSGHSGRPVVADATLWALHWALQVGVLSRVIGSVWPAASSLFIAVAALVWAAVATAWAWRYGRWLGQPRADGRSP